MNVQPYLFFDGHCDEALTFYKKAIGADVKMLMRFKDAPDKSMITPGVEDKVMHAQFQVGDTTIMASDGRNTGNTKFEGFALDGRGQGRGRSRQRVRRARRRRHR